MKLKYVNNKDQHAYYLDGKRCKSVTTVAKYPDDTYALDQWRKRMVAIGMARSPLLVEAVAAHHDDRDKLDGYCEDAMELAKAADGATRGVATHRITERHDLGQEILDTPLAAYVVASWQAALEAAELEVLPEYVERIVVFPDLRVAGRLDRILRHTPTGVLYVGDVKGGANAIKYPHSIATQIGMYANAPFIVGPIPDGGGESTQFDPMPDVDKQWGYIFHLPESGEAAVAKVDISAGWDAVEHICFPIMKWRARRDLCKPVAKVGGGELPTMPVAGEATPAVDVGGGGTPTPAPTVEPAPPADRSRREELRQRIIALPDVEREELARRWPLGVPTFKQSDHHTDAQLDAIAEMVGNVDWSPAPVDEPEPQPEPELPPAARWQPPDEGVSLDATAVDAITATIQTLDKVTLAQVNDWAREAHAADRPFSLSREDWRTQRRFEIMRAAIALSPYEPDVQRAALGFVMGDEVQPTVTVGAALGSLTITEATRLALLAESLGSTIGVVHDVDGVGFTGSGLAAVAA